VILYDGCLLPAKYCHKVIRVWNIESRMRFADWCAPWEVTNCEENLNFRALLSQNVGVFHQLLGWTGTSHCRSNDFFMVG